MRGSWRALGAVTGVVFAAAGSAPSVGAVANPPNPAEFTTYSLAGSLTVTWQSEAARGCAAAGLCGITGAVVANPAEGALSQGGSVSSSPTHLSLGFFGSETVRVRRDATGSAPSECVDIPDNGIYVDLKVGRVTGRFAHLQMYDVNGRCGGPLSSDLPVFALPVRKTGGSHPSYDLRGTEHYTAGPFIGEVISRLVIHAVGGLPGGGGSAGSSGSSPGAASSAASSSAAAKGPRPPHSGLLEVVELEYRVGVTSAPLEIRFKGEAGPFCQALDSCGTYGQLALTLPSQHSNLFVAAERKVSSRRTSRQVLSDFRAHPSDFKLFGDGSLAAAVHETFSWPGGPTCSESTDASAEAPLQLTTGPFNSARLSAQRSLRLLLEGQGQETGADALRTGCPGPATVDVGGQNGVLAAGSLDLGRSLPRRQTLELRRPGSFAGPGYVGRRSGALRLKLSLIKAKGTMARTS